MVPLDRKDYEKTFGVKISLRIIISFVGFNWLLHDTRTLPIFNIERKVEDEVGPKLPLDL